MLKASQTTGTGGSKKQVQFLQKKCTIHTSGTTAGTTSGQTLIFQTEVDLTKNLWRLKNPIRFKIMYFILFLFQNFSKLSTSCCSSSESLHDNHVKLSAISTNFWVPAILRDATFIFLNENSCWKRNLVASPSYVGMEFSSFVKRFCPLKEIVNKLKFSTMKLDIHFFAFTHRIIDDFESVFTNK